MTVIVSGPKAPASQLQVLAPGSAMRQGRRYAEVNQIDATSMTVTNRTKAQLLAAFSAAS